MDNTSIAARGEKYVMRTYGRYPIALVRGEGARYGTPITKNIWILSAAWRTMPWGTAIPGNSGYPGASSPPNPLFQSLLLNRRASPLAGRKFGPGQSLLQQWAEASERLLNWPVSTPGTAGRR